MKYLNTQVKNKVGHILLNRPEVKNALNLETINELSQAIETFEQDPKVRCILLASQTKEAFCSGADLKEFSEQHELQAKTAYFDALVGLILKIAGSHKPVIVKVHGYALAGGLSFLAAADIVYAANDAKFALPELKVGMVPGVVMLALEELVNRRALSYMAFSADVIDAKEALQIGLISKIFDKSILDSKTDELAENMAKFSLTALATTKKMLSRDKLEAFKLRSREMALYSLTPDCAEGIDAYLTKRKAKWD